MKVLYGVQGTGNGHISRARMIARHLQSTDIEVTYLFSGRKEREYFDMEIFGDCIYRKGLTFHNENGSVSYRKTLLKNNIARFLIDIFRLDTTDYDYIITDFEPITAWAGRLRGLPVIGIGHQYAFQYNIPRHHTDPVAQIVMRYFAPATLSLGLHWHHFNKIILPPIIDPCLSRKPQKGLKKILVYLPFENQGKIQTLLSQIKRHHFILYSPQNEDSEYGHLSLRKLCLEGFKQDLASSDGVICNTGFELISECLHLGLPILTKPQNKQTEQLSNAMALDILGYATTCDNLNLEVINRWLQQQNTPTTTIGFPDVAQQIVDWLASGRKETPEMLSQKLWQQTTHC